MKLNDLKQLEGKSMTINKNLISEDRREQYIGSLRQFRHKRKMTPMEKLWEFLWCQSMLSQQFEFFNLVQFSNWDIRAKDIKMSLNKRLQYKYKKSSKSEQIRKLDMILFLRSVKGILFIKSKLKKIELIKELFILELEQGGEVFIPNELK